jgi:hypothetical protein
MNHYSEIPRPPINPSVDSDQISLHHKLSILKETAAHEGIQLPPDEEKFWWFWLMYIPSNNRKKLALFNLIGAKPFLEWREILMRLHTLALEKTLN